MKAKRIPDTSPKPPPILIEITMTESEAESLLAITRRIGGEPKHTRRKHTDDLGRALVSAGVMLPSAGTGISQWLSDSASSLTFKNNSLPLDERAAE